MSKIRNFSLEENKKIFELAFNCKIKDQRVNTLINCIFHADSNASLSINLFKGVYNCFSCGAKGNTLTLINNIKNGEIK